jgi:hypothetical protein
MGMGQMIHYHGTPLKPMLDFVKSFAGKHAMISFENPDQIDVAAEICQSIALDNGAFSAWNQGRQYDFAGYAEWAARWIKHPAVDWCVIPDVIDGSEADNDALLRDWALPKSSSVPVWHLHETLHRLERLLEYPRVALGSSGQFSTVGDERWWRRIADAMRVVCDKEGRPMVKLHGLRMLDPGVFSKLPLSSADSCNVARNVGLDVRWRGPYTLSSRYSRAVVLMERIERHASAAHWSEASMGMYTNFELLG